MSDFKHATHSVLTKRKRKRLYGSGKGGGAKELHRPVAFIVGCPFCEWANEMGTRRPIEQRVSSLVSKVRCKAGHIFRITRG